ncbi:MAG: GNAT family N-acetyltransferase [Acidobacteria bacterium]|nr:GNAT family N-acetyltransferase [Acidobacteriota bacterium]
MKTMQFSLRDCSTQDSALLSLVACGTFLEAYAGFLHAQDILAHCENNNSPAAYEEYLAGGMRASLAEAQPGSAPVGYILTCEPDLPAHLVQPHDYELKRIYVFHRFQGTGVGRALMERALAIAHELERKRLLLGVNAHNDAAIAFYRRCGFEIVGERHFTVGATTHDDYVMGRSVSA